MRANQNKEYPLKAKSRQEAKLHFNERNMRRNYPPRAILTINLEELYQRFLAGVKRLLVAVKYRFYQFTAGVFDRVRLPWFKLGAALLILFIVTQKDIQFTVNMRAPLGVADDESRENGATVEEMSLAKTVSVTGFGSAPAPPAMEELNKKKVEAYINRFSKVAATEMEKFGIPASIKMAQALYESRAGEHPETRRLNNHFGAPMSEASYNSAWENWRAHSIFVAAEYAQESWGYDYKKWARGLENAGYSTAKNYADQLIQLIDDYQLYQLDIR